jgi:hypothetical protein
LESTISAEQRIVTEAWNRCRLAASRSIFLTLKSALFRRQMNYFRRWERYITIQAKQQRHDEWAKLLEVATSESASKLQTEKTRALVEAARFSTLSKKIEREKELAASRRVDTAIMTSIDFGVVDKPKIISVANAATGSDENDGEDDHDDNDEVEKNKNIHKKKNVSTASTSTSNLSVLLQSEASSLPIQQHHLFSGALSKEKVDERLHSHIKLNNALSETELLADLDRRIAKQYKPLDEAQVLTNLASELSSRLKKTRN